MPAVTVHLSVDEFKYIAEEIADGRVGSVDAFVSRAVSDYRRARGLEELDRLVQEGLDSGEPIPITPEYWERKKADFLARRQDT